MCPYLCLPFWILLHELSSCLSVWSEDTEYMHSAVLSPGADTVLCVTGVTEASTSSPGEQLGPQFLQKASPEAAAENSSSGIPSGQAERQPWAEAGMCHVLRGRILWQKDLGVPPRQARSQGVCSHLLTLQEAGESGKANFREMNQSPETGGKNLLKAETRLCCNCR